MISLSCSVDFHRSRGLASHTYLSQLLTHFLNRSDIRMVSFPSRNAASYLRAVILLSYSLLFGCSDQLQVSLLPLVFLNHSHFDKQPTRFMLFFNQFTFLFYLLSPYAVVALIIQNRACEIIFCYFRNTRL